MINLEAARALFPTAEAVRAALEAYLPRVLGALVVLLIGWLLAVVLRAVTTRVGAKLANRLPAGRARAVLGDVVQGDLSAGTGQAVYWIVFLLTLLAVVETLGLPALSSWMLGLTSYLPRILLGTVIVVAGLVSGRVAGDAVSRLTATVDNNHSRRLGRALQLSILVVAVLVAAHQVGVDISLLTTLLWVTVACGLSGASLAFALGSRATIGNILGMHYFRTRYRTGDTIKVADFEGRVAALTATSVVLVIADGTAEIPGHYFASGPTVRFAAGEPHAS